MSLQKELATLEREYRGKVEAAELKHRLLEVIGSRFSPRVFVSKLYDSEATITYKAETLEAVAEIVKHLPQGVPCVVLRGSCTSILTGTYFAALQDAGEGRGDPTLALPYFLKLDPNSFSRTATLVWFAKVAGLMVEFRIESLIHAWRTRYDVRVRSRQMPGQTIVESTDLQIVEVSPLLGRPEVIRWASGGPQYAASFTLYWPDFGDDASITPMQCVLELLGSPSVVSGAV